MRDGEKRIVTIQDGDPAGRHVVIVDDLVQTGGTLCECANEITRRGALSVCPPCEDRVKCPPPMRTVSDAPPL